MVFVNIGIILLGMLQQLWKGKQYFPVKILTKRDTLFSNEMPSSNSEKFVPFIRFVVMLIWMRPKVYNGVKVLDPLIVCKVWVVITLI